MLDTSQCPLPTIHVLNPMTHNTWDDGRYTTYDICIQTFHKAFRLHQSSVRRRFSEFIWLRKQLKSHHTARTPPSLPPKKFFVQRFDDEFIMQRQEGLEKFLNSLIRERLYLSDTVLHLFLQTNLSVMELNDFIEGKLSEDLVQQLWQSDGKKKPESATHVNSAHQRLSVSEDSRDQSEILANMSESPSDSTSEDSPSSTAQSDQEDKNGQGNTSVDSGLNLSHVTDSPDFGRRFPRELRPTSEFSINNQGDTSP